MKKYNIATIQNIVNLIISSTLLLLMVHSWSDFESVAR